MGKYLYSFIDVSGNYDFSPHGTKHLVFTSILTTDIQPGVNELYGLKHTLIDKDIDIESFHATEDKQIVRDQVFGVLSKLNNVRVDSVVVDKCKTGPSLRAIERFHPMMVKCLLKYPFHPKGLNIRQYDKVFIFIDRESSHKSEREALIKAVKTHMVHVLNGVPYTICMHSSGTHVYLQMVDYCSWAIYRKWESNDLRAYIS